MHINFIIAIKRECEFGGSITAQSGTCLRDSIKRNQVHVASSDRFDRVFPLSEIVATDTTRFCEKSSSSPDKVSEFLKEGMGNDEIALDIASFEI